MPNPDPSKVLSRETATVLLQLIGKRGERRAYGGIGIARGTMARALAGLPVQRTVVAAIARWVSMEKGKETLR